MSFAVNLFSVYMNIFFNLYVNKIILINVSLHVCFMTNKKKAFIIIINISFKDVCKQRFFKK